MTTTLTTTQAAEKLGVSERTVRNWIDNGTIQAHKANPQIKSVYRIPATEVSRIIAQRSRANAGQPAGGH